MSDVNHVPDVVSIEAIRDEEEPDLIHINLRAPEGQSLMISVAQEGKDENHYVDLELKSNVVTLYSVGSS